MAEQDEPETVAGVAGVQEPAAVPAVAERPVGVTRDEWLEFRQEVREALAAGRTPPPAPAPEVPQEPATPVAPAPESVEPAPEPETPVQPAEEPQEWGSGLFFRGRKKRSTE